MGNKGSSSSSDDAQLDDVKKLSRVMHVSEKQLQKMQKSFKSHSKGGNCVDLAGFTSLLGTFGVDLKQHQLSAETIFKVFDIDHSGTIEFSELALALTILGEGLEEDKLRLMFRVFDTDGSGFLDHSELKQLITTLETIYTFMNGGKGSVHDQVEKIMDKIDCNRDGSISVYEWIEQGKSIGLLDPLTHTKDGKDKGKKSKKNKISSLPHTFTSTYKMDKILGSGAFASVYNVINISSGVEFAAKMVDKVKTPKEHYFMIETEIEVFKRCGHENVVKMADFFETPREWIMVLEKITGGELLDRISERDRYREEDARKAIQETLLAVEHLHDRGVVHRDIKPENLLLLNKDDDAPIKLADFGTAHVLKDESEDGKLRLRCGTPVYAAPELIEILINTGERKGYGRPVDIWGVGIIMFSILGGYPPFWAEEDQETYQKILAGDPGYIPDYWDPVSAEAKDLLRKLFTVDPKKRPSASECLKHPWFGSLAGGGDLSKAQKRLKARRRWVKSINAIRSTVRIQLLFGLNRKEDKFRFSSTNLEVHLK
mmetsp:Transcript_37108/g.51190  ORF Transcript_37108/g.51190 Transcript_37108/m.51190 type:complete len:543 (+) Transcript_37108:95-1723(+)|eukprot:CAMPEP_0201475672 /NCGR_PEP_ID=MMETSP0151_2-20130828/1042_1 /ASSEMBLY_ACC=CAM_ASM_000257 /TAXON_ID=200890 /ORGANISM="Paramoeba atlantica, Strain 621/1 / CCAP 1560/9" /LENGTH=542 /DNA_ID=CAMNT_0047855823 /DNA_START=93 /DNA_END=1721 /DNA_ORIENTATION=+